MIGRQTLKNIRGLVTYNMANGKKTRMRHEQRKGACKPRQRYFGRKNKKKHRIDLIKRGEQTIKYRCPICGEIVEEDY